MINGYIQYQLIKKTREFIGSMSVMLSKGSGLFQCGPNVTKCKARGKVEVACWRWIKKAQVHEGETMRVALAAVVSEWPTSSEVREMGYSCAVHFPEATSFLAHLHRHSRGHEGWLKPQ
jgi:hypothetical protein